MMTKLLPLITGIVLLTLFLRFNNKQNNDPVLPAKSNFLLNEKYGAGITETKSPHSVTDAASLQQSSWYASAVSSISQQEYHFNYDERLHAYSTPNRKNNLRFYYDQYGFTAEPRTTLVAVDKDATGRHPGKKKIRYQPGWKVAFKLDTAQLGNGCWKVAGNTAEYNTGKIAVQYINSEEGMRQNFIIAAPLQSTDELKINFSIKTTLKTVLQNNQIQFFHRKAGNVLNYSDLKVWDANGKMLAANFGNNNNDYCINVDTKNASYPITIDPISSTPSAVLESNQAAASMGCAVSSAGDVNGDGYSDVLVGAYLYDNGQTDEGRVFIYHGSATGISTSPAATLESNQANSKFGYSVATAGDINGDGYSDIIVGAYFYDNGQTDEGAAFVYRGSATGINSTVFTTLESNQANAQFGISVACAGDVNGDGYSDVLVGANLYDNGQVDEGRVFVYLGSVTGINTIAASNIESNVANTGTGTSVSSAGDVNGDGYTDIVIGVPGFSNGQAGEGAGIVLYGSATGINTSVLALLECNQANAQFGTSVAPAGDVNGDGYSDVIAGAPLFDNGQTDEGAAFIFYGSATGMNTTIAVTLEKNQASANMGRAVACAGDVNGDGYNDVIVGANLYDNGETDEGAAFVYAGSASGISNTPFATLEINQVNAQFGISLASAGDVNGDGLSDIIIGANLYDNGQADEGAAFVYQGTPSGINIIPATIFQSNQVGAGLGYAVSSAGDVNKDGYSDIIVGANVYDNGQTNEGAVFLYLGSASGISATPAVTLESNVANAQMGSAVAEAGDINGDGYSDIVVAAINYNSGQGEVFIYLGSSTGVNIIATDTLPGNISGGNFGYAVSSAGDLNSDGYSDIVVGQPGYYFSAQNLGGAAFIFYGSAGGINFSANDTISYNQSNSSFGNSVARAGDINGDGYSDIVVGSPYYNHGQTNEGGAFIYQGSASGIVHTAAAIVEGNQAQTVMGWSVAGAGDVNGDGYTDIIVGAGMYDHGQTDEGVAFVYHGSATGLDTSAKAILENNVSNTGMGYCVASAGDVNGDGYSDVLVAASYYGNGQTGEGAVYVFQGSPIGISTIAASITESNVANAGLGYSLASAGDVNGDGYSDIIAGANRYNSGQFDEGAVFFYYGNNSGGIRNNLRLYNADLVTPLQQSNNTSPFFGAGLYAKSPLGRQKGKLVWETKREGIPFSGTPITNSTASTAQAASYSDLGLTGTELKQQPSKLFPTKSTYLRARVKYNPATAITGQMYGPWRYPEYFLRGTRNFNLSFITYVWTGLVNTAWENPGNWSSLVVPNSSSDVLIPPLRPRYPVINASTSIKSLTVSQGASTTAAAGITLNIVGN